MSRIGAWWLRTESKVADWCERLVIPAALPPVPPTTDQVIAAQLTRIADALESSQLGREATAPAEDPPQPPSPSKAAAEETGGACNDSILRDGLAVYCSRIGGHRGDHHNVWSGWRWAPHPLYVSP